MRTVKLVVVGASGVGKTSLRSQVSSIQLLVVVEDGKLLCSRNEA